MFLWLFVSPVLLMRLPLALHPSVTSLDRGVLGMPVPDNQPFRLPLLRRVAQLAITYATRAGQGSLG